MSSSTAGTDSVPEPSSSSFDEETDELTESDECSSQQSSMSCVESDLQDLYESFDFEDEASKDNPSSNTTSRRTKCGETALYSDARLTTFQSSLLIFQYAIRHSLTTKAFYRTIAASVSSSSLFTI